MANVDENNGYVALAANSSTGAAQALLVDPSTNFLEIDITVTAATPTLNAAKVDDNRHWTSLAVDDNGVIRPLLIDQTTGFLSCDIAVV